MKEPRDVLEFEQIREVTKAVKRADAVAQLNNLLGPLYCKQLPRFQMRIADLMGVRVAALTMFGVDSERPFWSVDDLLWGTNIVEETENSSLCLEIELPLRNLALTRFLHWHFILLSI